jgi:hypothetical protein
MRSKKYLQALPIVERQLRSLSRIYGEHSLKIVHPLLKLATVEIKIGREQFFDTISRAFQIQINHCGVSLAKRIFANIGLENFDVLFKYITKYSNKKVDKSIK